MTGADLIKWIQENHAENLDIAYNDCCDEDAIVKEVDFRNIHSNITGKWDHPVIYLS